MALIPHSVFPRSSFDNNSADPTWHPQALDLFDPFDELDARSLNTAVNWLVPPSWLEAFPQQPKVPQKYRITVDCAGFSPKSIKLDIVDDKLSVWADEEEVHNAHGGAEDFSHRSFKRTYQLPKLVEKAKMTSFLDTKSGTLVIDIPYQMDESGQTAESMWPQVLHSADGKPEKVALSLHLPSHIDRAKVHVTAKDRDIIVKAEDRAELPHGYGKFFFYRRSTMPAHTDMKGLKCTLEENGQLSITAPFVEHPHRWHHQHAIAIEAPKSEEEQHHKKGGVFANLFHKKEDKDKDLATTRLQL